MPKISAKGGDLVDFHVDMKLLEARMRNMDANMRDLTDLYREAVKPIYAAYLRVVPKSGSEGPHMAADVYKTATYRYGAVGLDNTGRARDPNTHSGVTEFGGTIPVPHSKTNPKLAGKRRMLSRDKPWVGGRDGTSYYLYPMWEREWRKVVPPFVDKLREICRRYMPAGTIR